MAQALETKKLSGKEKTSYGLAAVGKDLCYMLSASYVLYYFQDIMGVPAAAMGVILLAARVFDAFNDPIMGIITAKTRTRLGKFRPWLLIGTLLNAVILYVMFSAPPSLTPSGLTAYAAVFYILWGTTYTMMDIPFWSMIPAFTEGGKKAAKSVRTSRPWPVPVPVSVPPSSPSSRSSPSRPWVPATSGLASPGSPSLSPPSSSSLKSSRWSPSRRNPPST